MRLSLAILVIFCIGAIGAQKIGYGSAMCLKLKLSAASSNAIKNKYKKASWQLLLLPLLHYYAATLIDNLGMDKTLKAQNARVKKWVNNNFKEIGITKKEVADVVKSAQEALTARSRSVAYIKGLFALIKPKISAIKKKLWARDVAAKNLLRSAYINWMDDVDQAIPKAKLAEIQKIIANYEAADDKKAPKDFFSDSEDVPEKHSTSFFPC